MEHTNFINIGSTIANFRNINNLTQEELANLCGIHRTTISDIERGIVSPSLDILQKISCAFNINLVQLFTNNSNHQSYKIYQPHNGNLGENIINILNSNKYSRLSILVAYAKLSGINRLKDHLLKFKSLGGEINCFVGIDQCNTTYEALLELFDICDNLYIIHNQNPSHTYHHKVYMFDKSINENNAWLAIGSNNLTAGGLFINYESCSIDILDLNNYYDKTNYYNTINLFNIYSNNNYPISRHIDNKDFIDCLLLNKYVVKESQSRIISKKSISPESFKSNILFGKESFQAPPLNSSVTIDHRTSSQTNNLSSSTSDCNNTAIYYNDTIENINLPEIQETFWFEMRKSTGGSRNILDLSSSAKLLSGSVINTKYYTNTGDKIGGSVEFFDILPSEHEFHKDVIISFNGNEYLYSTILFADNNKSWRIQLKGESSTDYQALSQYGKSHFVNNILVFHKIKSNYYILEVIPGHYLNNLRSQSVFVASNGSSKSSKLFGKLK